jgi:hypothetical protein
VLLAPLLRALQRQALRLLLLLRLRLLLVWRPCRRQRQRQRQGLIETAARRAAHCAAVPLWPLLVLLQLRLIHRALDCAYCGSAAWCVC